MSERNSKKNPTYNTQINTYFKENYADYYTLGENTDLKTRSSSEYREPLSVVETCQQYFAGRRRPTRNEKKDDGQSNLNREKCDEGEKQLKEEEREKSFLAKLREKKRDTVIVKDRPIERERQTHQKVFSACERLTGQ